MKLLSLKLQNFRQHADTAVTFPDRGVVGIVGTNEGGKSTLLEAAAWALFGSRATRGTAKGLRWNRAPVRHVAAVELCFEVGGQRYRIERSESNAAVYLADASTPIAAGTDAVNKHVPELLGMTFDEFAATYLCAQKDLGRLAAMGGTERRQFVLGVMGMNRIDEALAACRKRKNEIARELDGLRAGLGEREPLAAEADTAAAEIQTRQRELDTLRSDFESAAGQEAAAAQALEASDARRREHEAQVLARAQAARAAEEAAAELRRLDGDLIIAVDAKEVAARTAEKIAPLAGLRAERDLLRQAQINAERRASLQEMVADAERTAARLREDLDTHRATAAAHDPEAWAAVGERYRAAEARLQELRTVRTGQQQATRAAIEQAGRDEDRARRRIEAIEAAGAEGACPTCARALGDQFATVVAQLRAEADSIATRRSELIRTRDGLAEPTDEEMEAAAAVDEARAEGERLREIKVAAERATHEARRVEQALREAEDRLAAFRVNLEQLGESTFDAARLAAVEAEIAALEQDERDLERARAIAERVPALQERLAEWRERQETAQAEQRRCEERIRDLAFDTTAHQQAVADAERARAARERAKEQCARAEEALSAAEQRRTRAEEALAAYDARAHRLDELTRDLRTHEAAAERLADFRTAQAAGIRPELEELTSGFIQILTDGRHEAVTLSDDFDVVLQEGGTAVEVVSGGTEDIAAIAMRLAVSQMIAERAGHPLSLLILDEPFGSLDEVRRGNVLALIRRLGGVFEQVLVISHVAETRDAVDAVIEVAYSEADGCSRVRQAAADAAPPALAAAEAA